MSRASSLYRLQELDLELEGCRNRVEEIKRILGDDEELNRRLGVLERAEAVVREESSAKTKAEHAVESQKTKMAQNEKALYGGAIHNPKELQDLQNKAEALQRFLTTLEDRLLEAMIQLEEAEKERDAASAKLDSLRESRGAQHADLQQEHQGLLDKIDRLGAEHEAAEASISPEDLALYQDLQHRLGDVVVALVQDGTCNACGVNLARSVQQSTHSGAEIVRCNQCNRILYAG
jgi:predicted  nucleic acid-binding Zn-ribbon protein